MKKGLLDAGQRRETDEGGDGRRDTQSGRAQQQQPFRLRRPRFHHFETTKVKENQFLRKTKPGDGRGVFTNNGVKGTNGL